LAHVILSGNISMDSPTVVDGMTTVRTLEFRLSMIVVVVVVVMVMVLMMLNAGVQIEQEFSRFVRHSRRKHAAAAAAAAATAGVASKEFVQ